MYHKHGVGPTSAGGSLLLERLKAAETENQATESGSLARSRCSPCRSSCQAVCGRPAGDKGRKAFRVQHKQENRIHALNR